MANPRNQRRKEDRPAEITAAAMHTFAEKGFAATKVADVAKRAGVSKGLLYLYFKTKEDLFKAVVRSFIFPMIENLTDTVENTDLGAGRIHSRPSTEIRKIGSQLPRKISRAPPRCGRTETSGSCHLVLGECRVKGNRRDSNCRQERR